MEEELTADKIADKVLGLTEEFNQYIFEHPEILDRIPDKAVLVFLDADDPTFNDINLELAETLPQPPGSQRVYIKMRKRIRIVEQIEWEAEVLSSLQPS